MELVEGETLRGPLPLNRGRVRPLDHGALDAPPTKSIIHRDLKPANIKVTPGGRQVPDFGWPKPPNHPRPRRRFFGGFPTLTIRQ
jgi:serine/threonine protein kinase